ncbi:MAG: 4a-hydroxytetrahydrobiopterin dehydratase [Ktedonobacterales bacterium]
MATLTGDELATAQAQLTGWIVEGDGDDTLAKTYRFQTFPEGITFVDRVAQVAEQAGHHPDIDIRYTTITVRLSTHDEGGVTQKDVDMASRIDALV